MRLWGRKPSAEEQEEPASIARLEELLYQLADDIAADDPDSRINQRWSGMVRTYAAQVGARQAAALNGLFGLFSNDPRNMINEQRFTETRTFREAMGLAAKFRAEHNAEEARLRKEERGLVIRPWSPGHAGKAVVYKDGTVLTSANDSPGEPQFVDLHMASGQEGNSRAATIGIAPDGACDPYQCECDEGWLAARLRDHHPQLHLIPTPAGT